MGFLGKASEFFAAPGASVGSFLGDALHNASNFACQLHYNTPGVVFDVSPFNRELWKEFCKDRPSGLPPPPVLPFTGGQCPAVYQPFVTFSYEGLSGTDRFNFPLLWGEIASIQAVPVASGERGPYGPYFDIIFVSKGNANSPRQNSFVTTRVDRFGSFKKAEKIEVVRQDGLADNCGNASVGIEPVVLPVSRRTTNINVVSVDKSTTNVITAIVEFPSTSVDFNLSVPLRVTIDGRQFHLNVDGWYTGFPSPSVSLPDVEKVLSDNVLQFEGTLNQYFAPINPSINNNLVLVSPSAGKKKGGEEKDIPGAQWLVWDLTRLPDKAQYGENSPTVYFAGWFSFYKEGRCMERRQINYERGIVRFPDGADGYGYTFTNGAEGDVSVYKEKPQDG